MITLISPAKTLDFESNWEIEGTTLPYFIENAEYLNSKLQKISVKQLGKLMGISTDLAVLNYDRFQKFSVPFNTKNARPAIFAFKGDVYIGLDAETLTHEDLSFAQNHLRILSGLYGLLRPLDLMQAYRLEMGTAVRITPAKPNLYSYWADSISNRLKEEMDDEVLINLASAEYFKAVRAKKFKGRIITPQFLDAKGGEYKMIGFFAKKARGLMSRYIIQNKINEPNQLKSFELEGYSYNAKLSKADDWVFTREENW